MTYTINLSGILFSITIKSCLAIEKFRPFTIDSINSCRVDHLSDDEISRQMRILNNTPVQTRELMSLIVPVSDHLLKYHRCVIHGLSFSWKNNGFLFCGPSGVGKTTQFRLWQQLYKDEIIILNGDKPILELSGMNSFILHPSPWTGKENLFTTNSMPLKGIVYLEQSEKNEIVRSDDTSFVIPLINEIFCSAESIELIDEVSTIIDRLITNIPIWKLKNRGDLESAVLTHDTISSFLDSDRYVL